MASQHLTGIHHTSTPHLDGCLKGIRDEFDRLNHELDETRKQRDEYMAKYKSQIKELQELRQTTSSHIVCERGEDTAHASADMDDNHSPISPVSSSIEPFHGDDATSENAKEVDHEGEGGQKRTNVVPITGTAPLSLQATPNVTPANELEYAWDVEYNNDTTASLNLNLVHKLSLEGRTRVTFSMDGKYLATASSLGRVSIFDSKTGERIMHSVVKNSYHDVEKSLPSYSCIAFSPDSKYVATGEYNGNVQVWTVSQTRVRNTLRHQDSVHALNFSPNGRFIVTCSSDKTAKIWRLRDGSLRVLTSFSVFPRSVQFNLDGRYIASGGTFGRLLICNARTGKLVASWGGHSKFVTSLLFTPDGKGLLSGSWDKQVIHWDVSSLSSPDLGMAKPISAMMKFCSLIGHTGDINTVSISPDGKWIASGSWDRTVRIWNAHDSTLHCTLHFPGRVWSAVFSPVGNYLAIGGDFEDVVIWNYVNP